MTLEQKIEQLSINIKPQSGNFPDLVSLALHQLAAVRLQTNPALIETAKANLQKWLEKTPNINAWLEWQNILETKSLKRVLLLKPMKGKDCGHLRHLQDLLRNRKDIL